VTAASRQTTAIRAAEPVAPADPAEARDPRLDGVRGLAIGLVLLFHATRFGVAATPWQRAALEVPALGWSGVDLFFVLSGFLITGILMRTRGSSTYYRSFYARRALRIFPLYYAVLLFWIVIAPHVLVDVGGVPRPLGAPVAQPFWYWAYLTNVGVILRGGSSHLLDVTWSLAIEEHFYLAWPWIVRRTSDRGLLAVCAATAVGALALRIAAIAFGAPPDTAYMFTLCRLDTLATGAAIAVLAARPGGLRRLARPAPIALAASVAAIALASAVLGAGEPDPIVRGRAAWMQTAGFTLLCAAWGSLLVWVAGAREGGRLARVFEARPLGSLGRYSYAIYLVHLPVAIAIQQRIGDAAYRRHFAWAQLGGLAGTAAISYLLARASWALLEEPMLRWKRRFPYRIAG